MHVGRSALGLSANAANATNSNPGHDKPRHSGTRHTVTLWTLQSLNDFKRGHDALSIESNAEGGRRGASGTCAHGRSVVSNTRMHWATRLFPLLV